MVKYTRKSYSFHTMLYEKEMLFCNHCIFQILHNPCKCVLLNLFSFTTNIVSIWMWHLYEGKNILSFSVTGVPPKKCSLVCAWWWKLFNPWKKVDYNENRRSLIQYLSWQLSSFWHNWKTERHKWAKIRYGKIWMLVKLLTEVLIQIIQFIQPTTV